MPHLVARFYKAPGEKYGRCPGTESLPDAKMLNEMMKTTIRAAQRVVDPPLLVPDDGMLGPVNTVPGGINYFRAGGIADDRITPFRTGADIGISLEMMEEVRARISKTFFLDQFQLGVGPAMTATEVIQRTEERLRLLGPVLGRLQTEVLGPLIERVYGILDRAGRIPPAPDQVQGVPLSIEYESPIAKSQQQLEANSILRLTEIMLPYIDRDPTILDRLDGDFAFLHVGRMFNVNPKTFRGDDEVDAIRAQRAEKQNMADEAAIAKDASLALNQTSQANLAQVQANE
jgi:hypothetical protein